MRKNIFCLLLFSALMACQVQSVKAQSVRAEQRAEELVKQLTLEEKVLLMMDSSQPVERLGIKPYNWWNEALHGVAFAGLATVFPQPVGMAASFDPDAVYQVFDAVSDEARAKNFYAVSKGSYDRYQGLNMWTPTVNILRDPRWGRGIETYGEDPYLTSIMGVQVVKGLQGPENSLYNKLHACAKHFAVHSGPEWSRHTFNIENLGLRDLYETYLPPFEALVKDGKVKEVMCAYNGFEGEPCCSNKKLLTHILREEWGFDGIIVSDCGAIADLHKETAHNRYPDAASASAHAVRSGTDLECGNRYGSLTEAAEKGLISEKEIDASVKRLLKARIELGDLDDPEKVSWTKIPYSVVASAKHDSIALEMARKSMTLLHNKENFLPLKRGGLTIAVVGPNANDSLMMWGNYNGTPPHTVTVLDGIRSMLSPGDKLIYEQGCAAVETTLMRSVFDQCMSKEGPGFTARYWNSIKQVGEPVAANRVATPFKFCTLGAIVFAPNVNLTDFSATYQSVFKPRQSGEVFFEFYSCGNGRLLVDGKEVTAFINLRSRKRSYAMEVKAGTSYDIQFEYEYSIGDAELNFDIVVKEEVNIPQSVARVKDADVVVFAGGISTRLEGEEMSVSLAGFQKGDRTDIELPQIQRTFLNALHEAGKKIVLVNCSGSSMALLPELENCEAILQAWYPGQAGGKAVAEVLFGAYNPAGRLPMTFYRSVEQLPDFEDYNMAGRTYRYMREEPLFPFGFGLSYTTFTYGKAKLSAPKVKAGDKVSITVPVTNTGKMDGEEVVQVYLKKKGDVNGPHKTLRAFKRVCIPTGKTINVELELAAKQFEWWDEQTHTMRTYAGDFDILIGSSSKEQDLQMCSVLLQ